MTETLDNGFKKYITIIIHIFLKVIALKP